MMNHPYTGSASYIYANGFLPDQDYPRSSTSSANYYPPSRFVVRPERKSSLGASVQRPFSSTPALPKSNLKLERYWMFNDSSRNIRERPDGLPRVTFDAPNPHIMTCRRKLRAWRRRFQDFRHICKLKFNHWIAPKPQLSVAY